MLGFFRLLHFLYSCLCSSETCDRNSEGRTRNVIETDFVAIFNGSRVAAVFAADTDVEVAVYGLTELNSGFHKLTNTDSVELSKGIVFEDLGVVVAIEELTCVVAREAIGHLGKVIGTEAEEISFSQKIA